MKEKIINKINTDYLEKCNKVLNQAYKNLQKYSKQDIEYEIYRSAIIKEFEIVLEQSGKLLKKRITPYFHTNKEVDKLIFKDIFRQAGLRSLLSIDEVERWMSYRDSRSSTTHDYGEELANDILLIIDQFYLDVDKLIRIINAS